MVDTVWLSSSSDLWGLWETWSYPGMVDTVWLSSSSDLWGLWETGKGPVFHNSTGGHDGG
jgi:hypothetical protein